MEQENQHLKGKESSRRRHPFFMYILFWAVIFFVVAVAFRFGEERGKILYAATGEEPSPLAQSILLNTNPPSDVDFDLFWRVWNTLKEKYVDAEDLDAKQMLYGAIQGMLSSTGDPYTTFFDPEANKQFKEDLAGSFEGIGAEVGVRDQLLTIISPLSGSPAEQAGIHAGDIILKIDGEETNSMTLEDAVSKMRGEKGTEVSLTVYRKDIDETLDIAITRDTIVVESIRTDYPAEGIARIKILQFGNDTAQDFRKAVSDIESRELKGLILDVRNDPGGSLDAVIDMAGLMLDRGSVVVMEEDHDGNREKIYASGGNGLKDIPTVVLINEGSASASEILAGALKDNRENVTLVGKTTFGKGSVQELLPLPQGTSVKVTVAKWLTPAGYQINKEGIAPDVEVDRTTEDYDNDRDPQLDKALEILKSE